MSTGHRRDHGCSMAGNALGRRPDRDTDRPADKVVDLVARNGEVRLARASGSTATPLNGTSPGPSIEVTQGQLLEVHLHNATSPTASRCTGTASTCRTPRTASPASPRTPCMPGQDYTYRFVADHAGTYWYHSHQVSHEQVVGGLLGPLVVQPRHADPPASDVVALAHTYDGDARRSTAGRPASAVDARPGQRVRVRVINTDNGPTRTWASAPYRVVAVDGHDVQRPDRRSPARRSTVTAGGRVDLEVTAPRDGSGVRRPGRRRPTSVRRRRRGGARAASRPPPADCSTCCRYGTPAAARLRPAAAPTGTSPTPSAAGPASSTASPGCGGSINGHLFPNVPMFVVREGDVVHDARSRTTAATCTRCTCTATTPWCCPATACRPPAARGGSTRSNVENGRATTSPSSPTTPASGWTTATTSSTPQQGLVTHLMYAGRHRPVPRRRDLRQRAGVRPGPRTDVGWSS